MQTQNPVPEGEDTSVFSHVSVSFVPPGKSELCFPLLGTRPTVLALLYLSMFFWELLKQMLAKFFMHRGEKGKLGADWMILLWWQLLCYESYLQIFHFIKLMELLRSDQRS